MPVLSSGRRIEYSLDRFHALLSETATYYRGVAIREIHDMVREVAERSQTLLQAA